jgi:hypothetical protein
VKKKKLKQWNFNLSGSLLYSQWKATVVLAHNTQAINPLIWL